MTWARGWGGGGDQGGGIVSGGNEGNVAIWDVREGNVRDGVRTGEKGPNGIRCLDEGKVVEVGEDGIKVWNFGWR